MIPERKRKIRKLPECIKFCFFLHFLPFIHSVKNGFDTKNTFSQIWEKVRKRRKSEVYDYENDENKQKRDNYSDRD